MSFAASGMIPATTVLKYFAGFCATAYVPYFIMHERKVFGGASRPLLRRRCA
jgi:hypothetical protein